MVLKAFSIRDAKAEIFHPPFYKGTLGEGEREFQTLCKDEKSQPNKYPEDFDLWHVGEYDDNTGYFKALDTPQHMIKAVHFVTR